MMFALVGSAFAQDPCEAQLEASFRSLDTSYQAATLLKVDLTGVAIATGAECSTELDAVRAEVMDIDLEISLKLLGDDEVGKSLGDDTQDAHVLMAWGTDDNGLRQPFEAHILMAWATDDNSLRFAAGDPLGWATKDDSLRFAAGDPLGWATDDNSLRFAAGDPLGWATDDNSLRFAAGDPLGWATTDDSLRIALTATAKDRVLKVFPDAK
ncbi:MAG: hypothetical protein KC912_25850 [Proteobacteria bacterium]|nr:hypothetical protein [Pseudomonadota bacterium]